MMLIGVCIHSEMSKYFNWYNKLIISDVSKIYSSMIFWLYIFRWCRLPCLYWRGAMILWKYLNSSFGQIDIYTIGGERGASIVYFLYPFVKRNIFFDSIKYNKFPKKIWTANKFNYEIYLKQTTFIQIYLYVWNTWIHIFDWNQIAVDSPVLPSRCC